jgi:membrane-associated HD superfamily phosphohydrolase
MVLNVTIAKERPEEETINILKSITNKFKKTYSLSKSETKNISEYFDKVSQIESEGGTVNPKSSARGKFQFLTQGEGNSFQTALNRYENLTNSQTDWLKNARQHNDPNKLTYGQEKSLAIANLAQMDAPTLVLFDSIAKKGYRNNPDAYSLYANYHHTNPDEATKNRAESILEISKQ